MPNTPAVGNGPIEFTDPDTGGLTVVPVGALAFDANGNLVISAPYTSPPDLVSWLNFLVKNGEYQAAPAVTPTPAMTIKSTSPGSQGNNVKVTIAITTANADPTLAIFSVSVTETDSYTNLSPTNIKSIIGGQTTPGSQPGLVHLFDADVPKLPLKLTPATALASGAAAAKAKLAVTADPSGTAFNFEAKAVGTDGNSIKVAIPTVDKVAGTFSLTATWTATATGVTLATLPAALASLGYVVTVSPPSSGAFSLPLAGTYQLSGGSDGSLPSTASATIPAGV